MMLKILNWDSPSKVRYNYTPKKNESQFILTLAHLKYYKPIIFSVLAFHTQI